MWAVVIELIKLLNAQMTEHSVEEFVTTYQSRTPLALGELWGIPIMLRLGLLETIRVVAQDIINSRRDGNAAHMWADRLVASCARKHEEVVNILYQMTRSGLKISNNFALAMAQRLQGADPLLSIVTAWLEQQLSLQGQQLEEVFNAEKHRNESHLVRLRNSIISLRFVSYQNWADFVERQSYVEQLLRQDPLGLYNQQDFDSRDLCRHEVERIARVNKTLSETHVALAVVQMCKESHKKYVNIAFHVVRTSVLE